MSLRFAKARVSSAGCRSGAEGSLADRREVRRRGASARASVLVAALFLALLVVPSNAFAQRDAFFSALLVFYKTLGGVYGDEGPQLVAQSGPSRRRWSGGTTRSALPKDNCGHS